MNNFFNFFRFSINILFFSILFFPHILQGDDNKICLTMIVRNEEKIIERCLNSVKDIVDCISICDTGSTDNTINVIEQFMQKNSIPGKIYKHEWKNFGHNRTLSFEAAQNTLLELGIPLSKAFLLLLDADMVLEIDPSFNKKTFLQDSYLVSQRMSYYLFFNTRLIRASLPWQSLGATHEYWSCKIPASQAKLKSLVIQDLNDGGCKADKFERDIKLLLGGLEQEPENIRYMFYLAESYQCIKNYDESIKWYKKRMEKGGWNEEVWYSKFMIGQCYEDMGQWEQALNYYLDAYQYNPERAEPLQQIANYYRNHEQYNLAYLYAKQASYIPFPHEQILFVSHPVYEYLIDQDLSICAYYTPFKEEGYAATNRLILKKNVPDYIKDQAYRNMLFYVPTLKDAKFQSIEIELPTIREGLRTRYNPMNPSIQKTSSGYDLICRTVNYIQIGAQHFKSLDLLDPASRFKTRNFLVQYDRDFHLLSQKEIIETLPRKKVFPRNVEGLEDCRLFAFQNSNWFTCTTVDINPIGHPQVSLCKLSDDRFSSTIQVEKFIPLMGPHPGRCEKNWLPFVKDDHLFVIYSYDPFTIYKLNLEKKRADIPQLLLYKRYVPKYDFSRFSGSASPIDFKNGYLFLTHETVYDSQQRNYMHRFVYMDRDFNIKQISKPFIFLHKGIEYCCGMTIDHSGSRLILSIGIEDREAYLCTVDLNIIESMLEPLP